MKRIRWAAAWVLVRLAHAIAPDMPFVSLPRDSHLVDGRYLTNCDGEVTHVRLEG